MDKKKKRKLEIQTQLHQHQDAEGHIFGKAHSLTASHQNKVTRCRHRITLLNEQIKELKNG